MVYWGCDPTKQKQEIKARKEEKSLKGAFSRSLLRNGGLAEIRGGHVAPKTSAMLTFLESRPALQTLSVKAF